QATHNVIDGLLVETIDQTGVKFYDASSDNLMTNTTVRDTGRSSTGVGIALLVGLPKSSWVGTGPDASNRNTFTHNTFGPNTRGSIVDFQEGTRDGRFAYNTMYGSRPLTGAYLM